MWRRTRTQSDVGATILSDTMFSAMGLLALILATFLVEMRQAEVERSRAADQTILARSLEQQARSEASALAAQVQALKGQLRDAMAALRPVPVEVLICVDGSASQANVLAEYRQGTCVAAEVGSRISPRFRMGIIVYRDAPQTHVFPMTFIERSGSVPSSGMRSLRAFIDTRDFKVKRSALPVSTGAPNEDVLVSKMDAVNGAADVDGAITRSLSALDAAPVGTKRILIICGDMGPFEYGDLEKIEPEELKRAERLRQSVHEFCTRWREARVLVIYSGKNTLHPRHQRESIAFFQSIADAAGRQGRFSDDASQIAASLVETIVERTPGQE